MTTTFEALWSGVPVLVMKGFNFNSRCGESIIKNGNLKYFLAENEDDYVIKAVTLAKNINKLKFRWHTNKKITFFFFFRMNNF